MKIMENNVIHLMDSVLIGNLVKSSTKHYSQTKGFYKTDEVMKVVVCWSLIGHDYQKVE